MRRSQHPATLGSTLFFMINIPNSSGFDIDYEDPQTGERPVIGKFLPMLTMLEVILSSIEADQYGTTASVVVLFMFALLGVIVMLNLLIAVSYRVATKEHSHASMVAQTPANFTSWCLYGLA